MLIGALKLFLFLVASWVISGALYLSYVVVDTIRKPGYSWNKDTSYAMKILDFIVVSLAIPAEFFSRAWAFLKDIFEDFIREVKGVPRLAGFFILGGVYLELVAAFIIKIVI